MPDQSTSSVIAALGNHIQMFGTFSYIHSDSGYQFTSAAFKDYCCFLGCEHRMSNIRYPQSNDLAERYIKTIKTALIAKLDRNDWVMYIPLIFLPISNTYKAYMNCSSAELVFGQTLRFLGDLCFNTPLSRITFPDDFVLSIRKFANECKPTDTRVEQFNLTHIPKNWKLAHTFMCGMIPSGKI